MSMVRNIVARCVLFGSLCFFAGCLEVESMEARAVADAKNDRLDFMIVSRGVWSSHVDGDTLKKDLANLRKCRDVAAVIWPGLGLVDFTKVNESGDDATWEKERWRQIVPFVDIEPGAFFVDEQGRLSFYQFIRIHKPAEFAALCSELGRKSMLEKTKGVSRETVALLEKAAAEQSPIVTIDGAGFRVRRPLSYDDHRAQQTGLWREVARAIRKAEKSEDGQTQDDGTERGIVQALRDNDVAIVRYRDATEYVIGTQGSEVCDYQMRGGEYIDNLMQAFVKDEPRPPALTQALIDKQFTSFHARDARLPAAYEELKKRAAQPAGR
ncbi:MAG: hypothetical protein ABIP94_22810 [Planctomycetota bacterium]